MKSVVFIWEINQAFWLQVQIGDSMRFLKKFKSECLMFYVLIDLLKNLVYSKSKLQPSNHGKLIKIELGN